MRRVYFDHLSATPLLPEALEAMRPYFTEAFGSPASFHQQGLRARDALAKAREQVAALINAESPEEIIFTSCGAEAANLAVKGVAYANQRRGNHLVVSAIEHPAVLQSAEFLQTQGFTCTKVKVDVEGLVSPDDVRAALTDKTILIAVHHVNPDLGAIEPIAEIGRIAGERGIAFFVDATASGGWLPIHVRALGANLLSLSPHRFYGPKGVGVLYRNRRARLASIIHGGTQEGGRRAGTENVPAIVGAGVAAEVALRQLPARMAHTAALQRRLWEGIRSRIEFVRLNGPPLGPRRISTTLNISTEFIEGEAQMLLLDTRGFAVASGASCGSKAIGVPPVLAAIGLEHRLAQGNLLLSLGKDNTEEEVDLFLEAFTQVVAKLRGMSPRWDESRRDGGA